MFLEAAGPSCEPVYLGPDIGMANIMSYNDADGTCTISMAELATVCNAHLTLPLATTENRQKRNAVDRGDCWRSSSRVTRRLLLRRLRLTTTCLIKMRFLISTILRIRLR